MKILIGSRRSGKTTELLKIANQEKALFLCLKGLESFVMHRASEMGLNDIVGFEAHGTNLRGRHKPFVIDDFDLYGDHNARFTCRHELEGRLIAVSQSYSIPFNPAEDEIIDLDKKVQEEPKEEEYCWILVSYNTSLYHANWQNRESIFLIKGPNPVLSVIEYLNEKGFELLDSGKPFELCKDSYDILKATKKSFIVIE